MTSVVLPLPETEQSITRPVITSVVNDIIKNTQMWPGIDIIYPAQLSVMPQPGSLLQDTNRGAQYEPTTKLVVEVEERFSDSYIGSNPISRTDIKPIFHDRNTGVFIKPIYTKTKVTLNLRYSHVSRNALIQWRDNLRMRLSQTFDSFIDQVEYHYLIPYQFMDLMQLIWQYRENQGGYGDDFPTYLASYSSNRLTQVSTLVGGDPRIGIREKQIRMLSLIEFDALLGDVEMDQEGTLWAMNFVYKFNYMKPIGCNMSYPLMIHNQLLPLKYIQPILPTQVDRVLPETADQLISSLRDFEIYRLGNRFSGKTKPICLPHMDDWYPETAPTYCANIVQCLCQINPNNPTELLNLYHLDSISLDPCILDYFSTEYSYLTQIYKSFYHIALYEDNILLKDQYIQVDSDLSVTALVNLDIRKRYHICLFILTDWSAIYRAAFDRFRLYPCAVVNTIRAISQTLNHDPHIDGLLGLKQLSIYDMYQIYQYLTGNNDFLTASEVSNLDRLKAYGYLTKGAWASLKRNNTQRNTVMNSSVIAVENHLNPVKTP